MSSPIKFINYFLTNIDYSVVQIESEKRGFGTVLDPILRIDVDEENENNFAVHLGVVILSEHEKNEEGQQYPYSIKIQSTGFFSIDNEIEPEERKFHINISAPSMLYGVIRTIISQITAHSGSGKLMIPSYQFQNLLPKTEEAIDNET